MALLSKWALAKARAQRLAIRPFCLHARAIPLFQQSPLAVCIETSQGALIERLLQTENCAVFPINPKAGKCYCTRKAPSGVKTDFRDAWAFADALRVDGHSWKQLEASDPMMVELRLLCRDEVALIEESYALINQLGAPWRNTIRPLWPPLTTGR